MPAIILGAERPWPSTVLRDRGYFDQRDTWLDFRGTLVIGEKAHFGFQVMLITASHSVDDERGIGGAHYTLTQVDDLAWVANRALLYNCHIQHHAAVGAGAVVKGVVVPVGYLAEGNPAMLVAVVGGDGRWERLLRPIQPPRFTEGWADKPSYYWRT